MADVRRDYSGFERRRHGNYDNPALIAARRAAALIAEARGWTLGVQADVDRALVILLSGHADGDTIAYSELFPALRRHSLSAERTIEVLQRVHLFTIAPPPSSPGWSASSPGWRPGSAAMSSTGCGPCATAGPARSPAAWKRSGAT